MQAPADTSPQQKNIINWFLLTGKIEGYSYLFLLFIAMPLKYGAGYHQWVRITGMVHGVLVVAFIVTLVLMYTRVKMPLRRVVIAFLLSLVPFGTFYLKRLV